MILKKLFLFAIFLLLVSFNQAHALTVQQFKEACIAQGPSCESHPILNAYIGGALDLLAGLQEQTSYLATVYCDEPEKIFDINKIINFIQNSDVEHNNENAMLRLVAYFEENGGC
ncbi:MAG: hypothetical protein KTR16_01905 [Acidiferrobacterales bacterium]|nr:hypothetical protein [Acidiferrobacterales bacterium]